MAARCFVLLVAVLFPVVVFAEWSLDVGAAGGWESDIGDDMEHSGASAAHGSAWLLGVRSFGLSETLGLHVGAGYSGRLILNRADMSHQGLFFEAAGLWLLGERWLIRAAPWVAGRHYGDPGRHSLLGGLTAVIRHQVRPGLAFRGTARASLRRAGDFVYDSQVYGFGAGFEIDLGPKLWLRAAYGFEGAHWPSDREKGALSTTLGGQPDWSLPEVLSGGTHMFAHVGTASLNLSGAAGSYFFAEYAQSYLVAQQDRWLVHAVLGGVGLRL